MKISLKNYGKNYKKIFNHLGINNFSNKQKNIYLIRDAYKKYFSLQRIFLHMEKYNHHFSRFLKFFEHKIYIQGKLFNENLKNSSAGNLLEEKKPEVKFLNFQNAKDAGIFKRKKFESLETLYANMQLNIYFTKWKLLMHKKIKEKIYNKKILKIFVEKIETFFVLKKSENIGLLLPRDFNNSNNSIKINNYNNDSNSKFLSNNRLIFLSKVQFFKNLLKNSFNNPLKNPIMRNFNHKYQIIINLKNLFEKKINLNRNLFFSNFKIYQLEKNKNIEKIKKLRIIFEIIKLSNENKLLSYNENSYNNNNKEKNLTLLEFIDKYYTEKNIKKNTLNFNFKKWKNKIAEFINKAKFNEKFKMQKYYNEFEKEQLKDLKESENQGGVNTINTIENLNINNNEYFSLSPRRNSSNFFINNNNNEINQNFAEKVINFTNNEFEIFFFKILGECRKIPKAKQLFSLRKFVDLLHMKNLNFFFRKFRVKINLFFTYNKLMAKLYSNKLKKNQEDFKNENYFIKISSSLGKNSDNYKALKNLQEQMGTKVKISENKEKNEQQEKLRKTLSFSEGIKPKRIDYLINTNQSKVILDYENDEMKLDKEINLCKKIILDPKQIKLGRLFFLKIFLRQKFFFNKWKNLTEYPENHYYDNILEFFECVKNENVELEFNRNKAKNEYKKLIQDYKTLRKFFCEECMNCHNKDNEGNVIEEFHLDMKSINSESSNLTPSDLRADSNYNSEIMINKNFRSNFLLKIVFALNFLFFTFFSL